VHGGQGLGGLADGKKIFVWNALPGEIVRVRIIKQRRSYAEGIAEEVLTPSPKRAVPRDANYLATSPWQMMTFAAENKYKQQIVQELFAHEGVRLPDSFEIAYAREEQPRFAAGEAEFTSAGVMENPSGVFHYRNKMEYGFWGDEAGLHLAAYQRGSHGKQIITGSSLAMPPLDAAANALRAALDQLHIRAGDLKTIIVRCNQAGKTVGALFVKPETFPKLTMPAELAGLRVYQSNPKSPASVPTKLLDEYGDCMLEDTLLGKSFSYDVDSFFQINLPVIELALKRIAEHMRADTLTDMYAGVGSIGLSVARHAVTLVELDAASAGMARENFVKTSLEGGVVEAPAEKVLDYIVGDQPIIFDPPRAGLHNAVVARTLAVRPPQIIYLSCNPATQARDLAQLQEAYNIEHFEVFNFFPRTPHIETLAVLRRKD
jgi:23S rRNA (uracil1939-C5)-methyltransferase